MYISHLCATQVSTCGQPAADASQPSSGVQRVTEAAPARMHPRPASAAIPKHPLGTARPPPGMGSARVRLGSRLISQSALQRSTLALRLFLSQAKETQRVCCLQPYACAWHSILWLRPEHVAGMRDLAGSSSLWAWCRVHSYKRKGAKLCTCSIRLPACTDSPGGTARRPFRPGKQPPDALGAPLRLRQAYRSARAARAAAMQLPAAAPTMALLGAGRPAPAAQAAGVRRACPCARVRPVCG